MNGAPSFFSLVELRLHRRNQEIVLLEADEIHQIGIGAVGTRVELDARWKLCRASSSRPMDLRQTPICCWPRSDPVFGQRFLVAGERLFIAVDLMQDLAENRQPLGAVRLPASAARQARSASPTWPRFSWVRAVWMSAGTFFGLILRQSPRTRSASLLAIIFGVERRQIAEGLEIFRPELDGFAVGCSASSNCSLSRKQLPILL